uniref:FAD-binding FR-type domain-containing protein n=1 Tax=Chromera velia CCMP2878 TaxID=1169474 RepID=A0A0G4GBM0_9ALVE|eukprot:Cvel_21058.t1-p1 / transcript=Cvel_21058.t1 / gene=Cvel_21058 / organism=Chromera_velia_CCMP2878 / gene_product=Respiratory burst oxidase homolog protein D, putative / transcript_product=Respiratory burst oxidase homolog protein D, putative / location=Cvel_scaffold1945:9677-16719(-) / protein_length=1296 / sequence_SO=supercontig / SO=protein_coding / is_pseudo=false
MDGGMAPLGTGAPESSRKFSPRAVEGVEEQSRHAVGAPSSAPGPEQGGVVISEHANTAAASSPLRIPLGDLRGASADGGAPAPVPSTAYLTARGSVVSKAVSKRGRASVSSILFSTKRAEDMKDFREKHGTPSRALKLVTDPECEQAQQPPTSSPMRRGAQEMEAKTYKDLSELHEMLKLCKSAVGLEIASESLRAMAMALYIKGRLAVRAQQINPTAFSPQKHDAPPTAAGFLEGGKREKGEKTRERSQIEQRIEQENNQPSACDWLEEVSLRGETESQNTPVPAEGPHHPPPLVTHPPPGKETAKTFSELRGQAALVVQRQLSESLASSLAKLKSPFGSDSDAATVGIKTERPSPSPPPTLQSQFAAAEVQAQAEVGVDMGARNPLSTLPPLFSQLEALVDGDLAFDEDARQTAAAVASDEEVALQEQLGHVMGHLMVQEGQHIEDRLHRRRSSKLSAIPSRADGTTPAAAAAHMTPQSVLLPGWGSGGSPVRREVAGFGPAVGFGQMTPRSPFSPPSLSPGGAASSLPCPDFMPPGSPKKGASPAEGASPSTQQHQEQQQQQQQPLTSPARRRRPSVMLPSPAPGIAPLKEVKGGGKESQSKGKGKPKHRLVFWGREELSNSLAARKVQALLFFIFCALFGLGFGIAWTSQERVLGAGVICARGFAMAIQGLLGLVFLLMSRGGITWVRNSCLARWNFLRNLLDEYRIVHMVTASWLLVAAVGHSAAHLLGTYRDMQTASSEDLESALGSSDRPSYSDLLQTRAAITGYVLVAIFSVMAGLSLPWVRRHYFEAFQGTHLLFYSVVPLMIVHGWKRAAPFSKSWYWSLPCFLVYLTDIGIRRYRTKHVLLDAAIRHACVVASETGEEKEKKPPKGKEGGGGGKKEDESDLPLRASVAFVNIVKPRGLECRAGQVMWIRCPKISQFQWHPFSLCSSPSDRDLRLMIGSAGDWTNAFLRLLAASGEVKRTNGDEQIVYPRIDIDGPFGAPADYSVNFSRAVFIGAATGMAPFLGYLNSLLERMSHGSIAKKPLYYPTADGVLELRAGTGEGNPDETLEGDDFAIERAHFIWINRRMDELFGALDALIALVLCPVEIPLTFRLFITRPRGKLPPEHRLLLTAVEALVEQAAVVRRRLNRQNQLSLLEGGDRSGSNRATPRQGGRRFSDGSVLSYGGEGTAESKVLEIKFGRPNFEQELRCGADGEGAEAENGGDLEAGGGASSRTVSPASAVGVFVCAGKPIVKSVEAAIQKMADTDAGETGSRKNTIMQKQKSQRFIAKNGVHRRRFVLVQEDFGS